MPDQIIVRNAVVSSNVAAIGFLLTDLVLAYGTLDVEFSNGSVYRYVQVPIQIYNELMKSESKGSFIAQKIKGKFAVLKLETKEKSNDNDAQG